MSLFFWFYHSETTFVELMRRVAEFDAAIVALSDVQCPMAYGL